MKLRPVLGRIRRASRRFVGRIIAKHFHKIYYSWFAVQTWENTHYLGTRVLKCPFDLWTYQEILYETKPDLIIETGTFNGGSAYYFAHTFDAIGNGQVVSIDIDPQPDLPEHPRIRYIKNSSTAPEVVAHIAELVASASKIMVILDSDHSASHVLAELRAYHFFVSPGCYLVVEDGNIHGHPVLKQHGPGPTEALAQFLLENHDFEVDSSRERHLFSFNPGGYLKKK